MEPTKMEHVPMKDAKYCFVPACKNNSGKHPTKLFFSVPNSAKREWCDAVKITCPKRILYISEDHLNFEDDVENYRYWITVKGRPKLKPRLPQSLAKMSSAELIISEEPGPSTSSPLKPIEIRDMEMSFGKPIITKSHKGIQVKPKTSEQSTYCVINKKKIKTTIQRTITEIEQEEKELPSTQGSSTSADISEVSSAAATFNPPVIQGRGFLLSLIKKKPHNYIGLPKNYYWLIDYLETETNIKSFNIIVTLYKIKNNIPFYQISDMFEVSLSTLWRIFFRTLSSLSLFFKQFIFSPNVYDVKRNLPSSFNINKEFSHVFCIIDCFEIEIEKPSNPVNQALTWSQYKSANTLKYLLAVTPDGFINFVSAGFGGRILDANIVENSGFLDVLPSNCTILADRGFKHIDTVLNQKQIKLLRPPSVPKDTKLTKKEAIYSKVIASLRIHVERVIGRIRQYKFLKPHSVINNKLIQNTDEVIIVTCGLVNLQNSIISNE